MEHERSRLTVWGFVKGLFKGIIGLNLLVASFLFLIFTLILVSVVGGIGGMLGGQTEPVEVPDGAALVFNPKGVLVEIAPPVDPVDEILAEAFGGGADPQVSVHELVEVVRAAKDDDRIKVLVLDLQGLFVPSIYASKAHYLSAEIDAFRESGKRVIAIGDAYSQEQYLIASEADTILMHDFGSVLITGYGRYGTYYKSALDMLDVSSNVFRVGTFKSAIEPFLRDDMSPAAKEANLAFLSVLWDAYAGAVADNRGMTADQVKAIANDPGALMAAAGGDMAKATLEAGLVDRLVDRAGQVEFIADLVGRPEDEDVGFKGIGYQSYATTIVASEDREDVGNVSIVTAAGTILDGEQPVGVVGGDTLARKLREARTDDNVKAVVLRVDSPGGSAFASEVIRDEVLAIKEAGKPVIVSMGSLAASGGYWISANADEIWSAPTTVTGSIGVFGYLPTFEKTLKRVGVSTDGVGTTPLASLNVVGQAELPAEFGDLIQASIEDVYSRFLGLVAEGRGMTTGDVDGIAQGRVWIGETAKELNLVDKLGTLDDAVAAAAAKAGLEDYDVVGMSKPKSDFELFMSGLSGAELKAAVREDLQSSLFTGTGDSAITVGAIIQKAQREAEFFASFNDPNAAYVRCLACTVE